MEKIKKIAAPSEDAATNNNRTNYRQNIEKNQEKKVEKFFLLPDPVSETNLSDEAKLVFAVLNTTSKKLGYSHLTNRQIAESVGLKPRNIWKSISELKKANLIHSEGLGKARILYIDAPPLQTQTEKRFIKIIPQTEKTKASVTLTESIIKTLCDGKLKKCTASNKYLANAVGLSESTIKRAIKTLKIKNKIEVKTTFSPVTMKSRTIFSKLTSVFDNLTIPNLTQKNNKEYGIKNNITAEAEKIPSLYDFYLKEANQLLVTSKNSARNVI